MWHLYLGPGLADRTPVWHSQGPADDNSRLPCCYSRSFRMVFDTPTVGVWSQAERWGEQTGFWRWSATAECDSVQITDFLTLRECFWGLRMRWVWVFFLPLLCFGKIYLWCTDHAFILNKYKWPVSLNIIMNFKHFHKIEFAVFLVLKNEFITSAWCDAVHFLKNFVGRVFRSYKFNRLVLCGYIIVDEGISKLNWFLFLIWL